MGKQAGKFAAGMSPSTHSRRGMSCRQLAWVGACPPDPPATPTTCSACRPRPVQIGYFKRILRETETEGVKLINAPSPKEVIEAAAKQVGGGGCIGCCMGRRWLRGWRMGQGWLWWLRGWLAGACQLALGRRDCHGNGHGPVCRGADLAAASSSRPAACTRLARYRRADCMVSHPPHLGGTKG